ncbi:Hpt domain-containing protein [Dankookia sp. P2]|uniref:Hpt domain-containing protein n=1 Tax=Dankookia sp. P2 TaxID=3423955 RepID=UPI003D673075
MLLTCRPAAPPRQSVPLSATDLAALCEEEVRTRLPRLQAAIAAGDTAAARMEAHAIRGVAASFGLDDLAEALLSVEAAARAGDRETLAAASPGLPQRAEAGLQRLARQPA